MLNNLLLVFVATAAGCTPCDSNTTMHGLAPRPRYDAEIDACITMKSCVPLCREVFQLDPTVEIRSCKIDNVDAANAHVVVAYYDSTCSSADSADIGVDDTGYYDGGDDGTTADGSSDDGSNEGTDDGSSGDSGGDSGGDSSSGDDGGDRHAPIHSFGPSIASQNATN